MWCPDCETIDDYFFDTTYFWLFLPSGNAFNNVAMMCGENNWESMHANDKCIRVTLAREEITAFLTSLGGCLSGPEFGQSKVTTTSTPEAPDLVAIARVASVETMVRRFQARWIKTAVEKESYQSWYQPIVHADSTAQEPKIFGHESLFRLFDEDNNVVPPAFVFNLADQSGLLYSVDLIARRSAVEHAARAQLSGKVFINFNPSSIYDPSYCLRSTATAINELGFRPEDIVFEVTETHQARDINHLKGILAFYRSCGFGVALDDIGSGWSSLNMMAQLRPDYIKIDMDLVRNIHINRHKQNIVSHLIQLAHDNGVEVIAEGIESEAEAEVLREMRVNYMQGYLFGKPAALTERLSNGHQDSIAESVEPLSKAAKHFDSMV
ncbi:EAL domain-containing protein [Pseudoalteromonas 'SMAR']|uniref:EAL domain-containing protein n=1 Tax=Pseudoalteromonas 'SMAR' TaxID=3416908 RepID=UPI003AF27655